MAVNAYFKLRKGGVVWTLIGLEFFQNLQGWLRIGEEEEIYIIYKSLIIQIYFVKKSWDIQHYVQCFTDHLTWYYINMRSQIQEIQALSILWHTHL